MKIYKANTYEAMSRQAANIIFSQVTLKSDSVLGLATGSTPLQTYQYLIDDYNDGKVDFSKVKTVNLDEYKGLLPDNPQSYHYFMHQHFFNFVNIPSGNAYLPLGDSDDATAECKRYDDLVTSLGQIDLQLLGIGLNGHIGFNEPSTHFPYSTHCVPLQQSTLDANKRFFDSEEDMPTHAYTMGIGTIFSAKKILLLANGSGKANILKEALYGPITPNVPASILQLHPDVTLVGDEAALSELELE